VFLVVHSIACKYHRPARFGDRLRIRTKVARATLARIDHEYQVFARDELLAEAKSTIACVDRNGEIRRMPECLVKG
jgi:acyl-CoA thioester hydrolase